jgi:hypothetical protein
MNDRVVRNNKWWYNRIRANNFFSFKYWWFNWLIFLGCIVLFWWFCPCTEPTDDISCDNSPLNQHLNDISSVIDSCCDCQAQIIEDTIPQQARVNCRVHFSDLIMGDVFEQNYVSKIYVVDNFSEYVGSGFYPDNMNAFPKSANGTFDGIAIDKGTRLIIYEKPHYQGAVLLDVVGPKLVYNLGRKNHPKLKKVMNKEFSPNLQNNYPKYVRVFSGSDMHNWKNGSCKIICNQ